ncbi:unnamed protein product [Tuber aestivum]|uniref:Uncharacterized protein n=1 Tax=Tuber aestivum TaxID=59557 RepID=A0A292PM32_9PEZI|nr:unnamed protein product [Tuber aestivum]
MQLTFEVGRNLVDILKPQEKMENPQESVGQSGQFSEYGEVRVILVRDEETRDRLRTELGRSSLVLTILQSKGMEFEDVFLFDFLSTSPYSHKFTILEELFEQRHLTDPSPEDRLGPAGWEGEAGKGSEHERGARPERRHNPSAHPGGHVGWIKENIVLCSELKVVL